MKWQDMKKVWITKYKKYQEMEWDDGMMIRICYITIFINQNIWLKNNIYFIIIKILIISYSLNLGNDIYFFNFMIFIIYLFL